MLYCRDGIYYFFHCRVYSVLGCDKLKDKVAKQLAGVKFVQTWMERSQRLGKLTYLLKEGVIIGSKFKPFKKFLPSH